MNQPIIEIPITDISIREAAGIADDGDVWYLQTLPPVLQNYPGITVETYWELTVAEHQFLVDWLIKLGVIDGN